jgi:hypothetical protein
MGPNVAASVPRDPLPPPATAPPASTAPNSLLQPPQSRMTLRVRCDLSQPAFSVAEDLQACIDRAPAGASVEIPRGIYLIHRQIVITRPVTIRTEGTADGSTPCQTKPDLCAILMASPALFDDYGLLLVHSTPDVVLEHIVVDGNRKARLGTPAGRACLAGRNVIGFNATAFDCTRCMLRDFVSRNALCGTGMLWSGSHALIERSDFRGNGQSGTPGLWADGLTAIHAPDSTIRNNRFIDNSDVGLILGYGVRTRVEDNDVLQRGQSLFAGIMLDNFTSSDPELYGDFRGAIVTDNVVDCRPQLCLFGIQLGPRPWYAGVNILGGSVFENNVHGAKVGINVDGAGVTGAPIRIFSNRVTDVPAGRFANCAKALPTGWMNVAPSSLVDRGDEATVTSDYMSDGCQFGSEVMPN